MRARWLATLSPVALWLCGCPPLDAASCDRDSDCAAGRCCVELRCAPSADAEVDGGPEDAGRDADALVDGGWDGGRDGGGDAGDAAPADPFACDPREAPTQVTITGASSGTPRTYRTCCYRDVRAGALNALSYAYSMESSGRSNDCLASASWVSSRVGYESTFVGVPNRSGLSCDFGSAALACPAYWRVTSAADGQVLRVAGCCSNDPVFAGVTTPFCGLSNTNNCAPPPDNAEPGF